MAHERHHVRATNRNTIYPSHASDRRWSDVVDHHPQTSNFAASGIPVAESNSGWGSLSPSENQTKARYMNKSVGVGRAGALPIGAVWGPAIPFNLTRRREGDRAVEPSQAKTSPLHIPKINPAGTWIFVRNAAELADINVPKKTNWVRFCSPTREVRAERQETPLAAYPSWRPCGISAGRHRLHHESRCSSGPRGPISFCIRHVGKPEVQE